MAQERILTNRQFYSCMSEWSISSCYLVTPPSSGLAYFTAEPSSNRNLNHLGNGTVMIQLDQCPFDNVLHFYPHQCLHYLESATTYTLGNEGCWLRNRCVLITLIYGP